MTVRQERQQKIIMLLTHFDDFRATLSSTGIPGTGELGLRMPELWTDSGLPELERCLLELRAHDPRVYRHVCGRYLPPYCQRRRRLVWRRAGRWVGLDTHQLVLAPTEYQIATVRQWQPRKSHGRPVGVEIPAVVETWEPWVELQAAGEGVAWLSDVFRGEPALPRKMVAA